MSTDIQSPHSEDIVHRYRFDEWLNGEPSVDMGGPYLELGSYGCREVPFLARELQKDKVLVHYGTGLALPRFQLILSD